MNNYQTPTYENYSLLETAFDHYNQELFQNNIPKCLITFQRISNIMGYFSFERFIHEESQKTVSELAINPSMIPRYPITELMQTMVHEMTHAWQCYHGKPSQRNYHNKEWAEKMVSIGLMPTDGNGKQIGQKIWETPIKGGLFQLATLQLFHSGFAVKWLERHNPPPPVHTIETIKTIWEPAIKQLDEEKQEMVENLMFESFGLGTVYNTDYRKHPIIVSKISKKKYSCNCSNVWGKPNLQIFCHACNSDFIEQ